MALRRSRVCRQAQQEAVPHDAASARLIALLNEPIAIGETNRLIRRARKLVTLFESLKGKGARTMSARLSDPEDALAILFRCELATAFRQRLRDILAETQIEERAPAEERSLPGPAPSPPDQDDGDDEGKSEQEKGDEDEEEEDEGKEDEEEEINGDEDEDGPRPSFDPDIVDYLRDVLKWARNKVTKTTSSLVRTLAKNLEENAREALRITGAAIVVAAIGYFIFDPLRRKLILSVAMSSLHHMEGRAISYFSNSEEFRDLEQRLGDILDLQDAIEEAEQVERLLDEQTSPIEVEPKTRGFAAEDFRVQKLFQKGFTGLPNGFPVFDAIRGNPRIENGIKVYRNAEGVSVKSTKITDAVDLLRTFENKYLKPLVDVKYPIKREDVEIKSLRKKAIHLVFEEGVSKQIDDATLDAVRRMKLRCNLQKVEFKWFVFVEGNEEAGDAFFKAIKKGE